MVNETKERPQTDRAEAETEWKIPSAPQPLPVPSDLVSGGSGGHYQSQRVGLLHRNVKRGSTWRRNVLAWLRDHVSSEIPRRYYNLVLGHDLHTSTFAELYARHFHYGQPDPFTGLLEFHDVLRRGVVETVPGWWEDLGLVSRDKVTVAFRTFEIGQLVAESSEYGDFKFHRVGTSAAVEDNTHTTLTTDAGITGESGTQVDADPIYRTVATVTADATETWQEHGIFSQAGTTTPAGTLMDRSLITPTVSVVSSDTVEFTYELTKNAEA